MAAGDVFLQFYNAYICGAVDNEIDLGASAKQWKDLYVNGLAYIDGFGEDTDMGDFDIHSIDGLYGVDDNVCIDMGADGKIVIQADGYVDIRAGTRINIYNSINVICNDNETVCHNNEIVFGG